MFRKWELVEAGKPMMCDEFNRILGHVRTRHVIVDVYRNGIYKTVERE